MRATFLGTDPLSGHGNSPTLFKTDRTDRTTYIAQGWVVTDPQALADIGPVPEGEAIIEGSGAPGDEDGGEGAAEAAGPPGDAEGDGASCPHARSHVASRRKVGHRPAAARTWRERAE